MRTIFIDALHLIARVYPHDPWHGPATQAARLLPQDIRLITTTSILLEFLAGMADKGAYYRNRSVEVITAFQSDPSVKLIHPSYDLWQKGLDLYGQRPDKSYSLVDCISMTVMREEGITEILSNDHHFEQEGFVCLIKRP